MYSIKINKFLIALILVAACTLTANLLNTQQAYAALAVPNGGSSSSSGKDTNANDPVGKCSTSKDSFSDDPALCSSPCKEADKCNLTTRYINPFINKFLAPLAIIAVIIGVVWGSIEYATSGGDSQRVAVAKGRIQKALIGLVAFIFLYAFLQWVIPGGIGF